MKQRTLNQFIQAWSARLFFGLLIVFGFVFLSPPSAQAGVRNLTKRIEPVSRTSGAFTNPFAVQDGDVLRIIIDYNVTQYNTSIVDYTMEAPRGFYYASAAKCDYLGYESPLPRGVSELRGYDGEFVSFKVPTTAALSGEIRYTCKVTDLATAESYNKLPEPMVGRLTAFQSLPAGTGTYYAGMSANEVILNYDPNLPLVGFDQSYLLPDTSIPPHTNCSNYPPAFPSDAFCYNLTDRQTMEEMISRTYIDESGTASHYVERNEIATLLYPANSIVGDAYSTGSYLNNFAFYGRNLSKSTGSNLGNGYSWGAGSYTLNPQAQSSYNKGEFTQRINQLFSEATSLALFSFSSSDKWALQHKDLTNVASTEQSNQYPEGKVWKTTNDSSFSRNITYEGVGTIIIDTGGRGDVVVENGVNIVPKDNKSFLGIIVRGGRLIFRGNNKIQAAVLVEDNTIGDGTSANNVSAIGSFVATDFKLDGSTGIRFFYDYRLDSGWPPGFRYFNMPTAKNTAQ